MKVLISAYACEPGSGSEPGAGWTWARAAAEHHEVWLLTRANNATVIDAELARSPAPIHPIYLDLPRWARGWKRGRRGIHLYYVLWQVLAWRAGRRLHAEVGFDVGHHLTLAVDWLPAGIAWIRGLPIVWGPVGGTSPLPLWAWRWLGARGIIEEVVREGLTRPLRRLFGDTTARNAAVVLAQNEHVARRFRRHGCVRVEPNVALDAATLAILGRGRTDAQCAQRAVFVGRLVAWKGIHLALAALATREASAWTLDVYGDGPELRRVERKVVRLGIGGRVTTHGNVPRTEILEALTRSHALLFPSTHDAAGWAVAEAVAAGLPVVCLEVGGPPLLAGSDNAAAIPPSSRAPSALADAMARLPLGVSPSPRWSAARLSGVLTAGYEVAVTGRKAAPGDDRPSHLQPQRWPNHRRPAVGAECQVGISGHDSNTGSSR